MRNSLIWITILLFLNVLNLLGWGLSKRFIVFDFLTAFILGIVIAQLSSFFAKHYDKYLKSLFLSLIFGLIIMPFILHYGMAIKLLEKTIGTNPTLYGIFLEGLFYAVKKTIYVVILSYPIIASIYFLKNFLKKTIEKRKNKGKNQT